MGARPGVFTVKLGDDPELDTLLAAKVLAHATVIKNQAGKMTLELSDDHLVADGKPVDIRITIEVKDRGQ